MKENEAQRVEAASLEKLLKADPAGLLGKSRVWIVAAAVVAVLAAAAFSLRPAEKDPAPSFATEAVESGTLVVKVSATGNLQPTNQVDVGSELSGMVDKVLVDDNDRVRKGEVLALLDLSKLKDAVVKSRASLVAAQAQVLQMQATSAEARAALARYRQVAQLSGGKVPSKAELDTAEANVKRAEANEANARAAVTQAQANLQSDRTNLAKATIRSPINGVVLKRNVQPGQTVAASFTAPVLFTLAEDLSKMELQVDVDEADVGQVKVGQKALFTVDAYPGRKFDAVITRVSYGSQTKNNVVSYLTVLQVKNDDLSLRPGMTGSAEITTVTRDKAILVPNAALRFTPSSGEAAAKKPGGVIGALMPRPPAAQPKQITAGSKDGQRQVWVLQGGKPVAVEVKTGASNGKVTEVVAGALKPGMQVITETLETKQ
ncbi:efflux RND transporter periplasmic adaptor subunit [Geomonas nitrogeniifigens]|uniref:Efflux RND transporter periplasmic adaptor subunit n=1 Tax=Geomonas diazotrophica TaxID=2843197 RepID=A0ABX8JR02_9BACT|nr:efflux RND transporter periplasmic adaptor subunit [Geomonas nitrogeniifigens]QWV99556.1 efflux RND transporter periplasmic adaptor subunit [Geomonas nitrogeniifigens]QXE88731.1 efflux RND transporter periplasmic adaptor subunit [Geomonas nitrogeniifigens]